ncbi:hypothetical protein CVT24_001445 [Panaeolus cyanescens]|uniref:MARVEL domain-containing protein n=1 Tax=Panaeolus cyanescens TaxID=181874 RepID=A0A409WUW6_9AGAR|nr:hypothetical protein CVT24_001445 [Panaeolus cyanescens]
MQFSLPAVRISLYCALTFFTFILFCLTAARLNYTGNLPPGDPLNGGRNFHDPIAVELLITCLMAIPWSIFVALTIHNRWENPHLSTFRGEIAGLSLIWIFYIIGAAVATVGVLHHHSILLSQPKPSQHLVLTVSLLHHLNRATGAIYPSANTSPHVVFSPPSLHSPGWAGSV